ncbi:MAG: uroporphyrinogen decarboxylase [Corynebacterium sp.]|nr:uroporphyrinogen decarboxylase [Corynebacterium sp.]
MSLLAQAVDSSAPTPVWFMRQAGRSLPEYLKVREGIPMLDSCFMPELAAEITLQPVRRHDVDAAIFFSDIVVPLKALGIALDIVPGRGPVVEHPLRTEADINNFAQQIRAALPDAPAALEKITEAAKIVRAELPTEKTLIGFAGAPFTLASYLIEGGPSRNHEHAKSLIYRGMVESGPDAWDTLMEALVDVVIACLRAQVAGGASIIQIFDSWVGCLDPATYTRRVKPYTDKIIARVHAELGVPVILFGVGTGELLTAMSQSHPDVLGVDWRVPLDVAATRAATPMVLQGNLDPAVFFAGEKVLRQHIERIKDEAARAMAAGTATGHIFNLGHGVLPSTDPAVITRAVEIIHET